MSKKSLRERAEWWRQEQLQTELVDRRQWPERWQKWWNERIGFARAMANHLERKAELEEPKP